MGKWCAVKCNCSNRNPLPKSKGSDFVPYECGHRDGALIQFWPGDLFSIGLALEAAYKKQPDAFAIFRRISDWHNYDDEYLSLSPNDAALWQLEIEQLELYLREEPYGWRQKRTFEQSVEAAELLYGSVRETLGNGLELCAASANVGNDIEFFW
jgi:hypothetical protein